ncbi:NADH-ubiquinone oxidoreductase B18 subunit family protein [Spinellus fusiger]|nr:NADH-ubiquinone oxidoreductase B18 subunit family protein [Spinellus fusiger]
MSNAPEMKVSQEEMKKARIPLEYRDYCAHLLIPLNKCRGETFYLPWKCENERHIFEKCQYDDYKRRMLVLKKAKEAEE